MTNFVHSALVSHLSTQVYWLQHPGTPSATHTHTLSPPLLTNNVLRSLARGMGPFAYGTTSRRAPSKSFGCLPRSHAWTPSAHKLRTVLTLPALYRLVPFPPTPLPQGLVDGQVGFLFERDGYSKVCVLREACGKMVSFVQIADEKKEILVFGEWFSFASSLR